VDAGNVKALVVSGSARLAGHPTVPTITETGVAGLELESWFGLFMPAKTPADVAAQLRADLSKVIAAPDVIEIFRKAGGRPLTLTAAETKSLVKRDVDRWTKLTRDLDIKLD
jgi:tripartite-type tricarboxylate transporter receptor subunit TctC